MIARKLVLAVVAVVAVGSCWCLAQAVHADTIDALTVFPPEQPWSGKSRSLVAAPDDPWITPSESTGLRETPRYDETMAWLQRLVAAAPELELVSIGRSAEGREIWMVVAASDGGSTPEALLRSGKPTLLAQAGIHSGEIDGKDAGLMLLRDMTVRGTRTELLESANFLFIPILNVDGHERFSRFHRINQRGPVEMGWRTNARNLNLNRDYTKLETEGVRAVLAVINAWQPDLYLDLHVTDGADYQYDITFGGNGLYGWSPAIGHWLEGVYRPRVGAALEAQGHVPGPFVWSANNLDMADGGYSWTGSPRFSNGYGDARHLPTVLVENHSLKSYDRRVLGTYVLLAASLELLAAEEGSLAAAAEADRRNRGETVPLAFRVPADGQPGELALKGVRSERYLGPVSGDLQVRWTGEPEDTVISVLEMSEPRLVASRPKAYLIPLAWREIAERLAMHGVEVTRLEEPRTLEVEILRLPDAGMATSSRGGSNPYEGRLRVSPGEVKREVRQQTFPAGTYRVDADQPLSDLAVVLLEPESPDSLFQWGYFLSILNRTEYVEGYIMEPLGQRMLDQDPELRTAFEERLLTDVEFATSPRQRLQWLYEKTPYFDQEYRVYPVARLPASSPTD